MTTRRYFQFLSTASLLLMMACPLHLRAQSAAAKPTVKFCCVVWEPLPITEVFYRDGKSYLPLEFFPGNR
jgi:hypothetical protein